MLIGFDLVQCLMVVAALMCGRTYQFEGINHIHLEQEMNIQSN